MAKDPNSVDLLTDIILGIFRLNGQLMAQGDLLVQPLGLTSARWQVLGAIAIAGSPQTAPQIAHAMGVTRQGTQKQLKLMLSEGLIEPRPNPRHERSPLHALTRKGRLGYDAAMQLQRQWARALAKGLTQAELACAQDILLALEHRLETSMLARGRTRTPPPAHIPKEPSHA